MEELKSLLSEVTEGQAWVQSDSDDGTSCFYCGAEVAYTFAGMTCTHIKDCLVVRIEKALIV